MQNESSIYLNGLKLTDPFHIRDFHSIFSLIDAHAVSGIKVYTGGFPVDFGDDASGVLLVDSKSPEKPMETQIGISLFNSTILNSGFSNEGNFDWMISARRSNLENILPDDYGSPGYSDIFVSLGLDLDSGMRITFNALIANDDVEVITESDPAELELSDSRTDNDSLWIGMEKSWGADLRSNTVLFAKRFSNRRVAMVHDPEEMIADVEDYRDVDSIGFIHNMWYDGLDRHALRWGLDFKKQDADYDYKGRAEYFGFAAEYPGLENPRQYQTSVQPSGNVIGLYVADQWKINPRLSMDLGIRWDKQSYTEPESESQFSPRASLLYVTEEGDEFRLSAGRYHQSERIHELQVENNIKRFYRPKRIDQFIFGYQTNFSAGYQFRAEAFYKNYRREIPRSENLFDPLQMVPEFQPDRVRLEPESARVTGIEFSVDYSSEEDFSWYLSYSISKAVDFIDGKSESRSWDQRHAIQAGLVWRPKNWEIGAAVRAHSGWPTTDLMLVYDSASEKLLPVPGPRNSERFSPYATLDFRVSRSFDVNLGTLSVFLEVLNATNRKNPCCVDYGIEEGPDGGPVLERNVEYWLPIVPSIGLNWRF